MHDHAHEHEHSHQHDFGEVTGYEETLYRRQLLLHLSGEIYKAGIPRGRVHQQFAEEPFFSPKEAVAEAIELVKAVDEHIVSCRIKPESVEDDASTREPES